MCSKVGYSPIRSPIASWVTLQYQPKRIHPLLKNALPPRPKREPYLPLASAPAVGIAARTSVSRMVAPVALPIEYVVLLVFTTASDGYLVAPKMSGRRVSASAAPEAKFPAVLKNWSRLTPQ